MLFPSSFGKRRRLSLALLMIASAMTALSGMHRASAATIVYTDRAAFLAATVGATTIDFNGLGGGHFATYAPLVTPPVTFTSDGTIFGIDPSFYSNSVDGSDFLSVDYGGLQTTLTATFDAPVRAVGTDIAGLLAPGTFSFSLSTGETFGPTGYAQMSGSNPGFIGFITNDPGGYTSLQLVSSDASGAFSAYDNFVVANVVVPEANTAALVGLALPVIGGIALIRRRKR
jgi:hypothetical protein